VASWVSPSTAYGSIAPFWRLRSRALRGRMWRIWCGWRPMAATTAGSRARARSGRDGQRPRHRAVVGQRAEQAPRTGGDGQRSRPAAVLADRVADALEHVAARALDPEVVVADVVVAKADREAAGGHRRAR